MLFHGMSHPICWGRGGGGGRREKSCTHNCSNYCSNYCSISSLWPVVALVKHCDKVKIDHISSLLPIFFFFFFSLSLSLSLPSFFSASFPPLLSPPFQTCLSSLIRLASSTERKTCITFSPVYPLPQRRARARSLPRRNRVKEIDLIINWSIYLLIPRPFWL